MNKRNSKDQSIDLYQSLQSLSLCKLSKEGDEKSVSQLAHIQA